MYKVYPERLGREYRGQLIADYQLSRAKQSMRYVLENDDEEMRVWLPLVQCEISSERNRSMLELVANGVETCIIAGARLDVERYVGIPLHHCQARLQNDRGMHFGGMYEIRRSRRRALQVDSSYSARSTWNI